MKKYLIVLSGIFVLSLGLTGIFSVLAKDSDGRIGQDLAIEGSPTAEELAAGILTSSTAPLLISASKTGQAGQFEIYTTSLQGFPTDGSSWALISTGQASSIAGTATTFYSYATYGPTASGWSHRGYWGLDIATLTFTLSVPPGATTLSFDWKFATEENPTYTWTYRDTAKAIVTTSVGSANILLLPDGNPVDVGTASLFSNSVGCSSDSPCPPYPFPNDVIYNAVTLIYRATFDVTPYVGEVITISFQIGDENDRILDSALFIDNLNIEFPVGRIFPDKAVGLAKEVIGAPYLGDGRIWGGKGYDCKARKFSSSDEIKTSGYYFYDGRIPGCSKEKGKGLDCSGLSFWSYNRIYFGGKALTTKEYKERPIYYEGANKQYEDNTIKTKKEDLKPGDLLFFDTDKNGFMDHVAMYIGGEPYNAVHASGFTNTITYANYNPDTEELITVKPTGKIQPLKVTAYGRVTEPRIKLRITAYSPVDLIVMDPDGFITSPENPWEGPMEYQVYDLNEDGGLDDTLVSGERKIGNYLIQVVPEPDALPTDTYTLEIEALVNGETVTIVLAENVPISNIPRTPYIIRSTETEIITIIPAFVNFDPDTLNLKSKGKYITVYIELPIDYNVNDIDVESIKLNNQISAEASPTEIADYDNNGILDLMIKFNRLLVQNVLGAGEKVKITIVGKLIDKRPFEGSDIIRVISEGK